MSAHEASVKADLRWVDAIPALDAAQAGSMRRMLNLAGQLPDDWSGMMGRSTLQEDFGALRFQLAYMSYALALTHVHHLPAAPGFFQPAFDRLIDKMLSPDVWTYWHYVGTGNGPFNKSLGELPASWNPVETDNIMYSAYIQSMAMLYHYLFRDAKYARDGALTFSVNPLFWGQGGKNFAYDECSLTEHLYWNMVERGYLGIACEPNCVFQICNQPAILGFRFHDLVYGGSIAQDVTEGYLRAWEDFGVLTPEGHYTMMVQEKERVAISPPDAPWVDFWMASLMHAWNPDFVEQHYPAQLARWSVDGPDDTLWIRPAISLTQSGPPLTSARDFGWAAVCASEVGDTETRDRLLAYADRFLNPAWSDGGYYYKRRDEWFDAEGRLAAMEPHTGNVLLGLARLNVPGGFRKLYDGPLGDEHFSQPVLVSIDPDIDIHRARFASEHRALVLRLVPLAAGAVRAKIEIGNLVGGEAPLILCSGQSFIGESMILDGRLHLDVGLEGPTDLVLSWA